MDSVLQRRQQQVLYDEKWKKFLRHAWVFGFMPFVDFAIASGSMAAGNVSKTSDFDVILGVRRGRIFTARFFAVMLTGIFGFRRKRLSHAEEAADKFCLNHFVTPEAYRLAPPYSDAWRELYKNLVLVYGNPEFMNRFWLANADWLGEKLAWSDDLRHARRGRSFLAELIETILHGFLGNLLERLLKFLQVRKIEYSLKSGTNFFSPRIIYNDRELEFHPDQRKFINDR